MTKQVETKSFDSVEHMDPTQKAFHEAMNALVAKNEACCTFSNHVGQAGTVFLGTLEEAEYLYTMLQARRIDVGFAKKENKSRGERCLLIDSLIRTQLVPNYTSDELLSVFTRIILEITMKQDEPEKAYDEFLEVFGAQFTAIKMEEAE